jgi:type VI secretion system protein ImpA
MELEPLLQPIASAPDQPCGPDLKPTVAYAEFQRLAQGKSEQYVGDKLVTAAEEPPWPEVIQRAREMLVRSKDLRIAVVLTRAQLAIEGWNGLAGGLGLIRGLVEAFWEHVHPQLDREDSDDPTLRINSLAELAHEDGLLASVRKQTLVRAQVAGRFSFRDVTSAVPNPASPEAAKALGKRPTHALITAAFLEADLAELRAISTSIRGALDNALAIEAVVSKKLPGGRSVNLAALTKLLQDAERLLNERIAPRLQESKAKAGGGASMSEPVVGNGIAAAGARAASITGLIESREDVIRALDAVCAYYRDREPSSPLPILIERAKGLVSKDFYEIVKDLAPGGVDQLEVIRGKAAGNKST